jgi:hypothetical protein
MQLSFVRLLLQDGASLPHAASGVKLLLRVDDNLARRHILYGQLNIESQSPAILLENWPKI